MHLFNKKLIFLLLFTTLVANYACCAKNVGLENTVTPIKSIGNIDPDDVNPRAIVGNDDDYARYTTGIRKTSNALSRNKRSVFQPDIQIPETKTNPLEPKFNITSIDPPIVNDTSKQLKKVDSVKKDLQTQNIVHSSEAKLVRAPMTVNETVAEHLNNITISNKAAHQAGAKTRGIIVFGSLALFSFVYLSYKIYKRRKLSQNNDSPFYQGDLQQFKYGVLTSNDNDHLEMSNLPLTAESEDEDEMEIFDLERRKYLDSNEVKNIQVSNRLLAKDDVEILDLDLPGSSNNDVREQLVRDDDLLDLVDKMNIPSVSVVQNKSDDNSAKNNTNDFFDAL